MLPREPTQEGLYLHYKAINDCADIPIVIYNIPGRTGITITQELYDRLLKIPNIIGMKDSSGDLFSMNLFVRRGEHPSSLMVKILFYWEDCWPAPPVE